MKAWLASAAIVALLLWSAACLYEVPGFADDPLGAGASSGTTSGSSGVGGDAATFAEGGVGPDASSSGQVGPGPGCVDTLDVPAKVVANLQGFCTYSGSPGLALLGAHFGVAWCDPGVVDGGPADALQFATLQLDGTVKSQAIVGAGEAPVTVAASPTRFAVSTAASSAIHLFDEAGTEQLPSIGLASDTNHVLLTASPGGFLVTTLVSNSVFQAQWLANGATTLGSAMPFPAVADVPGCCIGRRWTVAFGFDPAEFIVTWFRPADGKLNFEHVSNAGVPAANVSLLPASVTGSQMVPHDARMLLADCESVVRLTSQGQVEGTLTFPKDSATGCRVAVAGRQVRELRVVGEAIRWSGLDLATGIGPTMFELGKNPTLQLNAAWDGKDGFGIVWNDGAAIRYAHVRLCTAP